MKPIQLVYAKNIISRVKGSVQQELELVMLVENFHYDKQVEVRWAGEDQVWHTQRAEYSSTAGDNREYWRVKATFGLSEDSSLPGNVSFAVRYRVAGEEYWDNDNGKSYEIDADSGIRLGVGISLLNVDYRAALHRNQRYYPITIAVNCPRYKKVYIKWTTNRWKTAQTTDCNFTRNYWNRTIRSNARNPNRYGCEIWTARINIGDAYRLEYALAWETDTGEIIWDNNFGRNYVASRERLKMLTLNLHCYQEENQDEKFTRIAKAINDLDIDIVCLQEVGENWNEGKGDWGSNAANIINERLRHPYHLCTDWSHIGFDKYREGIAILSKYTIVLKDSGYVSPGWDIHDINSRKVVMVQVRVPNLGLVNVFSAHLSWWAGGFREQFENLRQWANDKHADNVAATFLCGDFNIKAGSDGYALIADTREYEDQLLKATAPNVSQKIFWSSPQSADSLLRNDGRIDYIFMKRGSKIEVVSARVIFTERDYGRVSDHEGHYGEFEVA